MSIVICAISVQELLKTEIFFCLQVYLMMDITYCNLVKESVT